MIKITSLFIDSTFNTIQNQSIIASSKKAVSRGRCLSTSQNWLLACKENDVDVEQFALAFVRG